MSTTTQLGGVDVTIHRPTVDTVGYPAAPALLGLDVESTYMSDRGQFDPGFRVRTVQLATVDEAWVFDVTDPADRSTVERLLAHDGFTFCSHTNMDVLSVWSEFGIDLSARNIDTHGLAIMADPDKRAERDLKALATAYGMPELAAADRELFEWMRARWINFGGKKNAAKKDVETAGWNALADGVDDWPEVFTRYAGLDAIACRRLVERLPMATEAPAALLAKEQWLDTATNRLQMAGMRVDTDALTMLLAEAGDVTSTAKNAAEKLTDGVNIAGPKIIGWLESHGADFTDWEQRTEKGAVSLAGDGVKALAEWPGLDDTARAVAGHMATHKGSLDLLNKTKDVEKRMVEERIHPNVNPRGATTTGRMSSSGPNVQNFSKKDARHRGLFLPDPGHLLATIDFAQVELRVVAALAREQKMIDVILEGGDLHQLTVDLLAERGITITRQIAKMTNFLIVYGGGGKALHEQAKIPLDVAKEIVQTQREAYPSISAYSQYLGMERDAIRTVSGRRLPVTRNGDGDLRTYASVNYAVQSAARELLVDAWYRFEVFAGHDGIVWLPIHDELVLQIPEDADVASILTDAERAMTMEFRGVPITAEAVILRDEHGVSRWMPGDLTHAKEWKK